MTETGNELDLRTQNKQTVEQYFTLEGPKMVEQRLDLFCQDGVLEVMFTPDGKPDRVSDIKFLRERMAQIKRGWTEFSYKELKVYQTEDPNILAAECLTEGQMMSPYFFQPHSYESIDYYLFFMREGKIRCLRQFSNPNQLQHSFWKIIPDKTI